MSTFELAQIKQEGTWHNPETGTVTDPAEIARLEAARDAELADEEARQRRIKYCDEKGVLELSSGRSAFIGRCEFSEMADEFDPIDDDGIPFEATIQDLLELAEIMIDRWERFKASLENDER